VHAVKRIIWVISSLVFATGCSGGAEQPTPAAHPTPLTFTRDIAPIVFTHCTPCHRPGQAAPFSLLTYGDVRAELDAIADQTRDRRMPPWLPEPGHGEFVGSRRLPDETLATLQRWIAEGGVKGDPRDLPAAPTFPTGWQLGTPDLVVTTARSYPLRPGDADVFRNLVFPVGLPEHRYVRAVEFQPGAANAVHHAMISVDPTRASRRRDGADGEPGFDGMITHGAQSPGGHFLGWAPGRGPIIAPEGLPWRLDVGTDIVVQIHLMPQAEVVPVQPTIGLYFTDVPPRATPMMIKLGSKAIDIPAGEARYVVTDEYALPVDVDLLSVYPHAHYRGREMEASATLPDGTKRPLLRIPRWDFHWQQEYRYAAPVVLPRGTLLTMRYTYDNSRPMQHDGHPRPIGPVVYGPNSSDEMGDLWLQVLPRSAADAATLTRDVATHEIAVNVAGAEALVSRVPASARNRAFLGSSYMEAGRTGDAIPHLQEAVRLDPKNASAHNYLAGALLGTGRTAEAILHFRRAVDLSPLDERMPFNLGYALNAAGRPAEAAAAFRQALARNPDFAPAHENLGLYLLKTGKVGDALEHLGRSAKLNPTSPDALNNYGAALATAGRRDEALATVRRALAIDPSHAPSRQVLALIERDR
jgi:Tfp pilus assembly protein PilF